MLIPDAYVNNIQERLLLYTELDSIETEEELKAFEIKLKDRFGTIPREVFPLFDALRIRWICKKMGFERLSLKNRKLRCYFIGNAQSPYFESELFKNMLSYISTEGTLKGYKLNKSRHNLILIKN